MSVSSVQAVEDTRIRDSEVDRVFAQLECTSPPIDGRFRYQYGQRMPLTDWLELSLPSRRAFSRRGSDASRVQPRALDRPAARTESDRVVTYPSSAVLAFARPSIETANPPD
jgi:hypothetical protein